MTIRTTIQKLKQTTAPDAIGIACMVGFGLPQASLDHAKTVTRIVRIGPVSRTGLAISPRKP